jgi:hypothetical protein
VANVCTNIAVKTIEGYDSILLHAQGLQASLFYSLTLTLFCIVLCFEYVKSWLCELSILLLLYLWRVYYLKNIKEILRASSEKYTIPILV